MNSKYLEYLVSLKTHKHLTTNGDGLITIDGTEKYEVIKGVPIMLPVDTAAHWQREMIEAILWQFPDEIEKMSLEMHERFKKVGKRLDPNALYREYIGRLLKDKDGIILALQQYADCDTTEWIAIKEDGNTVSADGAEKFDKYTGWFKGRKRVNRTKKSLALKAWAKHLPYYASEVHKTNPKTIVELSTGSGMGTSAISIGKPQDCVIFTIDIDYVCHGNVVGIAKYLKQQDSLLAVDANFWYMPFADESIDVVCSHFGLDESRENNKTIAETARILKSGGRFICTARKNAFMRQYSILEPFGFEKDETVEILRKCRLYSDTESLVACCENNGLYLENKEETLLIKTKKSQI
ncbi:MAG: methyltransferase domain-containing protein, partial [Eubacteriales bacterium]